MGMALSAADELLDANPAAARALLTEARDASAKALAELRDTRMVTADRRLQSRLAATPWAGLVIGLGDTA